MRMKKSFLAFLVSTFSTFIVVGFSACEDSETKYYINSDAFTGIVEYKSDLNYDGLCIFRATSSGTTIVEVTPEMIVYSDGTDEVGDKRLVVSYEEQEFTVSYQVKYKVQFTVEDAVVNTQYVVSAEEIVLPEAPEAEGLVFEGWTPSMPETIADNMAFEAQFSLDASTLPALKAADAVYGDTLADIELPQNAQGKWVFKDELTTPVGNVGKREFAVCFQPSDPAFEEIESTFVVNVAKKELRFTELQTVFVYDGTAHFPTYTLTESVDVDVIRVGEAQTDAGEYSFTLVVNDENYQGSHTGTFTVEKASASVTVESYEITFGESIPTVEYTVSGVDEALLNLQVVLPNVQAAGSYELSVTTDNTNVELTVNKGTLTVKKGDLNPADPTFTSNAVFGNTLSTVTFSSHANGVWSWKDPTEVIDTPNTFKAVAVFTPNASDAYKVVERELTIVNVGKKELTISVEKNEFVYDGTAHTLEYVIGDGTYTDVNVKGDLAYTDVGRYSITLVIDDARYQGRTSDTLIIQQAVAKADFTQVLHTAWSASLTLADIALPTGYAWKTPNTALKNVGDGQKYPVVFTPQDTKNYKPAEGELTVNVAKASAFISLQSLYTFTYNKQAHTLDFVRPSHSETSLVYAYVLNGKKVDTLLNAGTYTVTVTLPETAHYKEANATTTVRIDRAQIEYDMPALSATHEDTLDSLTLPTHEYGVWRWEDASAVVGDAGTQTHTAIFTPTNDNYASTTAQVVVEVAKKRLYINAVTTAYAYNGGEIAVAYAIVDGNGKVYDNAEIAVVGNVPYIHAGTYENIKIEINENNYTGENTFTLVINKATYVPALPTLTAVYGDTLKSVVFPEDEYGVWSWSDVAAVVGNAGEQAHKAVFIRNEEEGYDDYEDYETELKVLVAKRSVAAPTISSKTYTGERLTADISDTDDYKVVQNDGGIEKNEYDVIIELKDPNNHIWSDGDTNAQKTLQFSISSVANTWTLAPSIVGWIYGEEGSRGEAKAQFGTVAVAYKLRSEAESAYSETLPTAAGDYVAKFFVQGTKDYGSLTAYVDFVIGKATVSAPTISSKTYTGETLTASVDSSKLYTVTKNNGGVHVGSYEVELTLTDTNNYVWEESENETCVVTFAIVKATVEITDLAIVGWTFGEEANAPSANVNVVVEGIKYAYYTANGTKLEGVPTNAGTYQVKASVADTDDHFAFTTEGVFFTIGKATVVAPTVSSKTYTGETLTASVDSSKLYTVTKNDGGVNVGSYEVECTLTDADNYAWETSENETCVVTFAIVKAKVEITGVSITGWTYNEAPNAPVCTFAEDYAFAFEVAYTYYKNGVALSSVPKSAGVYQVQASVAGTDNYKGHTYTSNAFIIAKATPTVTWPTYSEACYENVVSLSNASASVAGTFTFVEVPKFTVGTDAEVETQITILFTPTDSNNYNSVTSGGIDITLKAPAYIGSTYYGTIEAALLAAESGNIVWVIPDANGIYITEDCMIKTGVSLYIPYEKDNRKIVGYTYDSYTGGEIATHSSSPAGNYHGNYKDISKLVMTNKVIVASGKTLTNEGTLEIYGQISGSGGGEAYAGHTAGSYASVVLESGAQLVSVGTIRCWGFIEESEANNGSKVTIENGGSLYQPFVLRDFRGGSYMYGVYKSIKRYHISAFNQYEMPNVTAFTTIKYGGELFAYATLCAGGQVNCTTIAMVGTNSSSFIQLTSGGYLTAKYDPETEICDMQFYGGATTNTMSLKLVLNMGFLPFPITVSTKDVYFPLTWRHQITLNDGGYTMNNSYKMMPGSVFTVQKGVTLTINKDLNIYRSFTDECATGSKYPVKDPAKFTVNGTVNVVGALGGDVYTQAEGAKLTFAAAGLTTYEVITSENYSVTAVTTIANTLNLYHTDGTSLGVTAGGTYVVSSGKWGASS